MRPLIFCLFTCAAWAGAPVIEWRDLPALPQALGGQCVGTLGNRLIVAGGSYWSGSQWSGGKKIWADAIYTLTRGDGAWRMGGHLSAALGYGAAVSAAGEMFCIGGQTASAVSSAVYRLRLRGEDVEVDRVADLPKPLMMMGSASLHGAVYLAGGQSTLTPPRASHAFLTAKLPDLAAGNWESLPAWPGAPRFFPQFTSIGGALLLTGGSDLIGDPPVRAFLRDAYRYQPAAGWVRETDLPEPVQAGLATEWKGRAIVLGGSDGSLAAREGELKDNHPGFSRKIRMYDAGSKRWTTIGVMPASLVTTGGAWWGGEFVIAGGEDRPGHRSARVIAARFSKGSK